MFRFLVTQARSVDRYGSPIDYLEDSLVDYFSAIDVDLISVSNCSRDISGFVKEIDFDGLVISGGGDVHPKFLKGSGKKYNRYSNKRDSIENELIDLCIEEEKMVIGICYGMQKLNTYFGGSISSNIINDITKTNITVDNHSISIVKPIFGLKGEYFVNQFHNQTIEPEDLAIDLKVIAIDSSAGNIEAFIHSRFNVLGVQWHPDRKSPNPEFNNKLISMFINN